MKWFCAILIVTVAPCWADTKGTPEDDAAIRQVIANWTAAFNRHEPALNAADFSDDFDVVTLPGVYIREKPDLGEAFKAFLRTASKIESVDRIRFIRSDVALVDTKFQYTGTAVKPDPKGLETVVLVKENGRWLITALRPRLTVTSTTAAPAR